MRGALAARNGNVECVVRLFRCSALESTVSAQRNRIPAHSVRRSSLPFRSQFDSARVNTHTHKDRAKTHAVNAAKRSENAPRGRHDETNGERPSIKRRTGKADERRGDKTRREETRRDEARRPFGLWPGHENAIGKNQCHRIGSDRIDRSSSERLSKARATGTRGDRFGSDRIEAVSGVQNAEGRVQKAEEWRARPSSCAVRWRRSRRRASAARVLARRRFRNPNATRRERLAPAAGRDGTVWLGAAHQLGFIHTV